MLGESIPKLAQRLQNVTNSNYKIATRTARTAVIGAQNAGRVNSYIRAQEMGIKLEQEWLATLDTRTRHSHRRVDGERVAVGEKFSNGCRYPADPQAPYSEVMNCRCTLVAALEGVEDSAQERFSRLPKGMTYEQWKRAQSRKQSGAISGALTDENDPTGSKRDIHAERYYEEVRKRNTQKEIKAISENAQVSEQTVKKAYEHVFIKKHELENGYDYFTPDYDMAQSWQRLREGKHIQPHDVTLLHHEAVEAGYMQQGYSYDEAHAKTCKKGYNYSEELKRWQQENRGRGLNGGL